MIFANGNKNIVSKMFLKTFNSLFLRESSLLNGLSLKPLVFRHMTMSFSQSELIDKWKTKFEEEKVPEIESSLENILERVLDKEKVR